ncbi:MAG: ABC transporter ATP-binding protein [Chloroflexaceae bacterium]|nr:ABC transporter ATP-binding protein [Chloroflexaceae bacterium]
MALLELNDITKAYADAPVLRGVSLAAAAGEIVALLGPSGCGKTTLLRIVAGLEAPEGGTIVFAGQEMQHVPTHQRGFGMMFQDYALFPHRNVTDNVAFGLRMQHQPRPAISGRVSEMLALVGLAGYERRRVYELSGGERQRVALARALAPRPRLLMLDEPLAALDRALRERLQDELGAILRQVGVTSLYVTHDQSEAFALADRLVLMNAGQVVQQGPPEQVYRQPANAWAARFLGLSNLVAGVARADGGVDTVLGSFAMRAGPPLALGQALTLLLYPDAASSAPNALSASNVIEGTLVETQFRGRFYRVRLRHASGQELAFELDLLPGSVGDHVALTVRRDGVVGIEH